MTTPRRDPLHAMFDRYEERTVAETEPPTSGQLRVRLRRRRGAQAAVAGIAMAALAVPAGWALQQAGAQGDPALETAAAGASGGCTEDPVHGQVPTGGEQPTDSGEQPTDDGGDSTPGGEQPTDDGEQPTDDGGDSTPGGEQPTDSGEQPTEEATPSGETPTPGEEGTPCEEQPTPDGEEPTPGDGPVHDTVESVVGDLTVYTDVTAIEGGWEVAVTIRNEGDETSAPYVIVDCTASGVEDVYREVGECASVVLDDEGETLEPGSEHIVIYSVTEA
ncbi:hypothetical protein [Glycomyces paridis]|uniref:Uncharacterized protein n=1 Tax=Glycomyces paridis TaxID=2126555 RepID=A0A4S8P0F3_9ACTN|nr:hypothetical protein [Glycomyces paridis]THV22062.1 hypothetical protein E9998_23875 [Glycomyces paridis]